MHLILLKRRPLAAKLLQLRMKHNPHRPRRQSNSEMSPFPQFRDVPFWVASGASPFRRGVTHLPIGNPFADDWKQIARSVGDLTLPPSPPSRYADAGSGDALAPTAPTGSMIAANSLRQASQHVIPDPSRQTFKRVTARSDSFEPLKSNFVNRLG